MIYVNSLQVRYKESHHIASGGTQTHFLEHIGPSPYH